MGNSGKRTLEKSVLIVEDDRWSAEAITMLLESDGYRSRTASSGTEALREVERTRFDVVLLDIALADSNGGEVGQQIHERSGPPIVIMSAAPDSTIADAARASHAVAVLRKPFDSATLRRTLAGILDDGTATLPERSAR